MKIYMHVHHDPDFLWLFKWYHFHCDEDGENGPNITIESLSNPGWYLKIDLRALAANMNFADVDIHRTDSDWVVCTFKNGYFEGNCGPYNLPEVLHIFRQWGESKVKL